VINSRMLPNLKLDADGGLTLALQHHEPPKAEQEQLVAGTARPVLRGVAACTCPNPRRTTASGNCRR